MACSYVLKITIYVNLKLNRDCLRLRLNKPKHLRNPLAADTSGDGFSDGFIVGEGLSPTADCSALRSSTISNVVSDSEAYGLYSLDKIKDLRQGSAIIEVFENQATVQLKMEESSDLQTWEDAGDPATVTVPADNLALDLSASNFPCMAA